MDMANRALCYSLRNPPDGVKKTPLQTIIDQKLVIKLDGSVPSPRAISEALLLRFFLLAILPFGLPSSFLPSSLPFFSFLSILDPLLLVRLLVFLSHS